MFLIVKLLRGLKIGFEEVIFMENQILIPCSSIDRDCTLILDAVRRLKDGTWHLCDEESDWADYLLPIIKQALNDHIEIENTCIFPGLPKNLVDEHSAEHIRMLALLSALDESRLKRNANYFKALLGLLLDTLDQHHQRFACRSTESSECTSQSAKERINRRAEGSNLECK